MKKLISMTKYTLQKSEKSLNDTDWMIRIVKYAKFLTQPLEPWMFVPCDNENNVLKSPNNYFLDSPIKEDSKQYQESKLVKEYKKAEDKVLFKGFKVHPWIHSENSTKTISFDRIIHVFWYSNKLGWVLSNGVKTVEDFIKYNLELNKEI